MQFDQLRPHQKKAVSLLRKEWKKYRTHMMYLPTGAGKTAIASYITGSFADRGLKVLFCAPFTVLVTQTQLRFHQYGLPPSGIIWRDHPDYHPNRLIQIASADTLIRRDFPDNIDLIIVDECFTGDVEVLTEKGWVRFDQLKDEKIAQSDLNGAIDYCDAEKVEKQYSGKMYKINSKKLVDFDCTAGHELVLKRPSKVVKIEAEKANFNYMNDMFAAGHSELVSPPLTYEERLMIATQADGSIHKVNLDGTSLVYFSFAKQRKIDRLRWICEFGGYRISEISSREGLRRFSVSFPKAATKKLSDWLGLDISERKAREIIEEVVCWDGHKKNDDYYYYSSVEKENTDFLQAVCVLAGYKSNQTTQEDNRKDSYKTVHRLFIQKNTRFFGTQSVKKTPYNYEGKVYCVRVPKGNIFIRRNGKPVLVGNCHLKRKKLLEIIETTDIPVIGLSGTPFSPWIGAYYESLIKPCTMRELIDQGYLSDYEFYAPTKPDLKGVKSRPGTYGLDYVESEVAEVMGDSKLVGDIVGNWLEHGRNLSTIAFCCNVAHANHVANEFCHAGVPAEVVSAKTTEDDRQMIFKRFDDGVTRIICNVGVLVAGFDADVRCIIYARPTKSEIRWVQTLGRGLRSAEGKDKCLIFDHSGSVIRLGFPDHIEYDELPRESDGMEETERQIKEREKKEKQPRECSKCHYMKPAGVYECPKCGHRPRAGEDVEVDTSRKLQSLSGDKVATKEEKQNFYAELCGFQKERQLKGKRLSDGWLSHTYKDKFGVWPKGLDRYPKVPSPETRKWIQHKMIKFAKGLKRADG